MPRKKSEANVSGEKRIWLAVLLQLIFEIHSKKSDIQKVFNKKALTEIEKKAISARHFKELNEMYYQLESDHMKWICDLIDIDYALLNTICYKEYDYSRNEFINNKIFAPLRLDVFN